MMLSCQEAGLASTTFLYGPKLLGQRTRLLGDDIAGMSHRLALNEHQQAFVCFNANTTDVVSNQHAIGGGCSNLYISVSKRDKSSSTPYFLFPEHI